MDFSEAISSFISNMGFHDLSWKQLVMILISFGLMYLAIAKDFEPLLLLPIGFGTFIINLPGAKEILFMEPSGDHPGGLFYYIYKGVEYEIFPPLIFLGIGAMTDFGPLIANPVTFLLGGAAQLGIFGTFFLCHPLIGWLTGGYIEFTAKEAGGIGIIGGADGPTSIYTCMILAPHLLGPVAVSAYTYMSMVPIIQPPIMKLLTTKKERKVVMKELRPVSKREKIIFPIVVMVICAILVPPVLPLVGMLCLGNLLRESLVVERLSKTAQNELINIVTIFLATSVGTQMHYSKFLQPKTIGIFLMGLMSFAIATAGGVLFGKLMYKITGGKINPLIGAAGVSAVPMASRVVQKVGQEEDPQNFLLMHAMGPNVAGVIGTAVAAGILISVLG